MISMSSTFRHAICNEAFDKWNFREACHAIRKAGYSGIEIAPFTLAEDPAVVTAASRREYRDIIHSEGLEFVGLHWLMVSPKGLHVTTPDTAVQTLEEAVGIVKEIGSPGVRTMFDTHNAVDEVEPHAVLVDRYYEFIRHVHVNELDGKHCGKGDYDFKPVLEVLRSRSYAGWVSLEAFDFSYGAETIANESLRYLENQISLL
jgi:sugar phosphate isomerase/epimerase